MRKAVFVVGPTASGKSGFATLAAASLNTCIINSDSVQFYNQLRIGSAAPSDIDKSKCIHHLYQCVDYPKELSAGDFTREFNLILEKIKNKIYFVVGGTGFYLQAIEFGMFDVPASNEFIRYELENLIETPEGHSLAYEILLEDDPDLAKKIHYSDKYRIVRALEILKTTGKKPSEMAQTPKIKVLKDEVIKIAFKWDPLVLKKVIEIRTKKMLQSGLIDEVQTLLNSGVHSSWAPLQSVGYKETVQYLNGELNLFELENLINLRTSQLAKKQMTWFKRDSEIKWFQVLPEADFQINFQNIKSNEDLEQDLGQGLSKAYAQAMDYLLNKIKD